MECLLREWGYVADLEFLFAKSSVMWHKYTHVALASCHDVHNYVVLGTDCTVVGLSQIFVRGTFFIKNVMQK